MTPRIQRLRTRSLEAVPSLSDERARLLTRFYQSGVARTSPIPIQRAMAFAHIMRHKAIHIGPDELIVGERGPSPKATSTYPEVCLHSPEDLEIIAGISYESCCWSTIIALQRNLVNSSSIDEENSTFVSRENGQGGIFALFLRL